MSTALQRGNVRYSYVRYIIFEHSLLLYYTAYCQIIRGVQFIHSQGILHLDLKPFNIMFANLQDDYNLRIIDFGLAEQLQPGQEKVMMKMCGTLEYMSPEVMDCKYASPASGSSNHVFSVIHQHCPRYVGGGGDSLPAGVRGGLTLLGGQQVQDHGQDPVL